ncbi:MAG: Spy/CpxP family protein refolding chaperone [Candidatus Coatesbacteria bacterium]
MTKTRWMMAAMAAAVLLAPMARADGDGGEGAGDWMGGKMGKALQLTPDQKAKLKTINEEQMATQKPLWETLGTQLKELKGLVDGKAPDGQLTAKLDQIKATRDQIMRNRMDFQGRKEAVLTPVQRAKVTLAMAKHMKEMMGGKGKGRDRD